MPWKVVKRDCKQADGKKGKYVIVKVKPGGKTEKESCHTSDEKAKSAVRARYANEKSEGVNNLPQLTINQLRHIIVEELGRLAVVPHMRGQNNAMGFTSGIYEEDEDDNNIESETPEKIRIMVQEELSNMIKLSEGLKYHMSHAVGVDRNIFRPESDAFFALFREVRSLSKLGSYHLQESERELIEETDIGEFGIYEGEKVPLDFPMLYEEDELEEAKYKGREVKLGAKGASRIGGGRARVYTRDPKSGKVVKVEFGSPMSDAMGDSDKDKARRKSYGARHNCADKKDKTKPGYWSCRATKMFGRNISGWW